MERRGMRAPWLALGILALAWDVATAQVVGLRGSYEDVFVAVRGIVPAGTVVRGIRFFSNDATTFPEILLASDAGEARLPHVGSVLRSLALVSAGPGDVSVEFQPYAVTEQQYLWAVIRFPDETPMRAVGLGGGPGIGWRKERILTKERSFFSVMGAMNEFSPAFDIVLLTGQSSSLKARGNGSASPDADTLASLEVRTSLGRLGSGVLFRLSVPHAGHLTVDVYSIAGRRVLRLLEDAVPPGAREIHWDGHDGAGRSAATGIYLYKVELNGDRRTGKLVLWR